MPRQLLLVLFTLVLELALLPAAHASGERAGTRQEWADARENLLRLHAECAVLRDDRKGNIAALLPPPPGSVPTDEMPGGGQTLAAILQHSDLRKGDRKALEDALTALTEKAAAEEETARREWREDLDRTIQFLLHQVPADDFHDCAARILAGPDTGGAPARFTLDGPVLQTAFWAWILCTASLLLSLHEGRRGLRRWWRARGEAARFALRAGLTVLLLAWVMLLGWIGTTLFQTGEPLVGIVDAGSLPPIQRQVLRNDLARLEAEHNRCKDKQVELLAKSQQDRAFADWADRLGLTAGPDPKGERRTPAVEKDLKAGGQRLREVLVSLQTAQLFLKDRDQLLRNWAQAEAHIRANVQARKEQGFLWARLAVVVPLVLAALVPPLLVVWRRRAWLRREGQRCPRCLDRGRLQVVRADVRDTRFDEPRYVCCREPQCQFRFRLSQRYRPRLCFPTVGLVDSGKTHWLLETYQQILDQRLPAGVTVTRVPSLGDDTLDAQLRLLREEYRTRPTAAVEGQFPHPVTLHYKDRDRSPGLALLNLFDFGGEMTARPIDVSRLRRRALEMDALLFFLDPTKPTDRQKEVLNRFYEDLREARGIRPAHSIHVPVAVCLTKLDLLPRTRWGTRSRGFLQRLRQTKDAPVNLPLLHARSRMVTEEALPILFDDWELERELSHHFGRSFLFFPLTPVGLEEGELEGPDVTDLSKRTIAPVGIVEPILWLLHVQGYQVFPPTEARGG